MDDLWIVRLTHWYAEKTDYNLNRSNGHHCRFNSTIRDPIVCVECEHETEEILEDDHDREPFNCQVAWGIRLASCPCQHCREGVIRYASTIYKELATAPITMPATSNPKNTNGR